MAVSEETLNKLTQSLTVLITKIGTDMKTLELLIGSLESLSTAAKTNLVLAINEIATRPVASGGAEITSDTSSETGALSAKAVTDAIDAAINTAVTQAKNDLLGGEVSSDLDTLRELGQALKDGSSAVSAITQKLTEQGTRLDTLEAALSVDLLAIYNQAKTA
ncbi:hypothetical protein C8D76_10386 [Pasteurella langaaensis DSM 22999]|uniref:Uncharacterized protein n=1 Tax=Alitibacter langaaensis DSM 22999 TaxID=1122935 RepID=A0A2U0TA79_9PAST|nr:hypothetical protein [Pasteurella langaaensis]PVX40513.1 hypothetical protein C8D76_10386 [Pasteurella langaaensis DSM 22999]